MNHVRRLALSNMENQVISQADDKLKSIPNYTKEQIEELLAPTLNAEGLYDFHK
jgi:hypothetical protein